jgi:hypothetical protein
MLQGMAVWNSRTNADDRLAADPLGRVKGRNGIVEGRDVADVRLESSVPHPLDDLAQVGTIGQDDEVCDPRDPSRPGLDG